jgi:hypothetical protein
VDLDQLGQDLREHRDCSGTADDANVSVGELPLEVMLQEQARNV